MAGTAITMSTTRIMTASSTPPVKPATRPHKRPEARRHDGNGKGDLERALAADHEPSEDVEAVGVGAERAAAARAAGS